MPTPGLLGSALALGLASGLSLYGTVFLTGLAIRLDWLHLGSRWESLRVLADPLVLGVAGVLLAIELCVDKIPWIDSAWDAIHTVIRPMGGALLALGALGDLSPPARIVALLVFGSATLTVHAAKASLRLAVNTSPEPVSNALVSLTEHGLLLGGVWLALAHPLAALGIGIAALAAAGLSITWLARRAGRVLRRLRRRGAPPWAAPGGSPG